MASPVALRELGKRQGTQPGSSMGSLRPDGSSRRGEPQPTKLSDSPDMLRSKLPLSQRHENHRTAPTKVAKIATLTQYATPNRTETYNAKRPHAKRHRWRVHRRGLHRHRRQLCLPARQPAPGAVRRGEGKLSLAEVTKPELVALLTAEEVTIAAPAEPTARRIRSRARAASTAGKLGLSRYGRRR